MLFHDAVCLEHNPSDVHPEHPARLRAAWQALLDRGLVERCTLGQTRSASAEELAVVHQRSQIELARRLSAQGGGYIESDTPLDARSFGVACWAAGTCLAAVDAVAAGESSNAFCLIRPPGHHATAEYSMGFCLFNNIALAARHALDRHGLGRVLIVDWDVHHGNGTQDIFYDDPRVMFCSMHRHPFYPGSGLAEETGTGAGLGFTRNVPISADTDSGVIVDRFLQMVERAAADARPDLVFISAGFDAHHRDPIGGLRLDREHFVEMLGHVEEVARSYAGGRIVSVLEGGYNVRLLGDLVADHVEGLLAGTK